MFFEEVRKKIYIHYIFKSDFLSIDFNFKTSIILYELSKANIDTHVTFFFVSLHFY